MLAKLFKRVFAPAPPAVDAQPHDGYARVVRSRQGIFIVNEFDQGVGWQLQTHGACDEGQMNLLGILAAAAPRASVILDIGANIGVAAVVMARAAGAEASIYSFEPQRHLFNMLAGNLALNAADNVICRCEAVGSVVGEANLPRLNYRDYASFGSVELNRTVQSDAQQQAYEGQFVAVPMIAIDSLELSGVGLIKIDVEGMEMDVLTGARATIAREMPLMYVEHLKSDKTSLALRLAGFGYRLFDFQSNFVCVPEGAPFLEQMPAGLEPYETPDRSAQLL